jgi:hypothetical protein
LAMNFRFSQVFLPAQGGATSRLPETPQMTYESVLINSRISLIWCFIVTGDYPAYQKGY